MRHVVPSLVFGGVVALGLSLGCAATGSSGGQNSSGAGGHGAHTSTGTHHTSNGSGGNTFAGSGGNSGMAGGPSCAQFSAEATLSPAAMLFVLDKTASMATVVNGVSKWGSAQLAVVSAIDQAAFDNIGLGLVTFPDAKVCPPECLCTHLHLGTSCCMGGILNTMVACGVATLPQEPITDTGTLKSTDPTGIRHDILNYLTFAKPTNNMDDGSPVYDALSGAYASLKLYSNAQKRIAVLITDGGFSCTSLASPPRPGYLDPNKCPDWEEPTTMDKLIKDARTDPTAPIDTFIVGVPGSNSKGEKQGSYDTPPYSMLLALSTYAVSGSPNTVPANCDKTAVFTQAGLDPTVPCHFDLSSGTFDASALAAAISQIRGQSLGCVYNLPTPPAGQTINPALVNVHVTINGTDTLIKRRVDPNDMCTTDGCWDYNAQNQVVLIGKTCSDLNAAMMARVDIYVGCATEVK